MVGSFECVKMHGPTNPKHILDAGLVQRVPIKNVRAAKPRAVGESELHNSSFQLSNKSYAKSQLLLHRIKLHGGVEF